MGTPKSKHNKLNQDLTRKKPETGPSRVLGTAKIWRGMGFGFFFFQKVNRS